MKYVKRKLVASEDKSLIWVFTMSSVDTARRNLKTSTGSLESLPRSEASLKPLSEPFSISAFAQRHVNVPLCKIAL